MPSKCRRVRGRARTADVDELVLHLLGGRDVERDLLHHVAAVDVVLIDLRVPMPEVGDLLQEKMRTKFRLHLQTFIHHSHYSNAIMAHDYLIIS